MLRSLHGGDIYSGSYRIDFSVNVNPFGLPSVVKRGLCSSIEICECYPDIECQELRAQIGLKYDIPLENVICGNGASDLIFKLVQVKKPGNSLICAPTFSEYENALKAFDCTASYFKLSEMKDFQLKDDFESFLKKIEYSDMVWICNPNNPVGEVLDRYFMERILNKCMEKGIFLVVDECFSEFVSRDISIRDHIFDYNKLFVINAFTKTYAMAGLRLGYGFCGDQELLKEMNRRSQPWSVSSMAQKAGMLALSDEVYLEKTKRLIDIERRYMLDQLYNMGIKVYHSDTNFIFFREREGFAEDLKKEGFLIRNCSNFRGLEAGYYRTAVRLHEENVMLLDAIRRIK